MPRAPLLPRRPLNKGTSVVEPNRCVRRVRSLIDPSCITIRGVTPDGLAQPVVGVRHAVKAPSSETSEGETTPACVSGTLKFRRWITKSLVQPKPNCLILIGIGGVPMDQAMSDLTRPCQT